MSKRKRDDDEARDVEDQDLQLKVSRLRAKIGQGVKALHNALKLARGFERQKLGRRQKSANSEPKTLLRLREEVIVLKQLELEKTARSRLLKNLVKTKRVSEHPAFIKIYGPDPRLQPVKQGAEANVVGRLFNSHPVKQALSEILKTIYQVLKIPQSPEVANADVAGTGAAAETEKMASATTTEFEGFSSDGGADHLDPREDLLSESMSDEDDLFEHAKGRLASSEDDFEDDGVDLLPDSSLQQDTRCLHAGRETLSVSLSASDMSEDEDQRPGNPPTSRQKVGQTAFLPSLSLGGYYSGSESGDDADQYHGPALPKLRKNRRGQRARQQLAELKHGAKAKHLGKQTQADTRSGWDAKRGAIGDGDVKGGSRARRLGQKHREDTRPARVSRGSKADQAGSKDDQGPIHPSWEAAKRRKMQDQQKVSFTGKKVTFD